MTKTGDDKRKHIERIRALKNKTVANGCTEEEALSAARLADELMSKYDLSLSDVEMRESEFAEHIHGVYDDIGQRLWKIASAVGDLTGCESWVDRFDVTSKITFFGRDSDIEIAAYVLAIAERAVRDSASRFDKELRLYRSTVRRAKRIAFLDGMVDSLTLSIRSITWARRRQMGTGLVVLKEALVADELQRRGITFTSNRSRGSRDFDAAYGIGRSEADKVKFEAGITAAQSSGVLEPGGRS